jgi:hypothetical protein
MKAEDIWKSHPQFWQYPIDDFKKNNKNMKILVSKKVMRAATEDAIYLEDMQHHPEKSLLAEVFHSGTNMQLGRCLLRMCKMDLSKVWGQRSYGN